MEIFLLLFFVICSVYSQISNEEICNEHISELFFNIDQGQEWALKMYDSSPKLPGSLLMGTLPQLGNFDECVRTSAPGNEFIGQYCRVNLNITSTSTNQAVIAPLSWSVCAPSTCGPDGVTKVVQQIMNPLLDTFQLQASASYVQDSCFYQKDESTNLDAGFWATIGFFCFILTIVLTSTAIEFVHICEIGPLKNLKIQGAKSKQLLFSFSLYKNMNDLWSVKKHGVGTLSCLNGMRVLSIAWVILGHEYVMDLGQPITNLFNAFTWFRNHWTTMPVMNGYLSVDTFFFMAGLLTCYVYIMENARGKKFNILFYYIYRYLRLTPALLICVLFLQNIVSHIGRGPQFGANVVFMEECCKENWWLTLLYVNNYINASTACLGHSWYLSIDMQLAILAPFAFLSLRRWPKPAAIILSLITLALCFYTFTKTYLGEYWWTLILIPIEGANTQEFLEDIYINTIHRASPYIVGIGVGYILAKTYGHHIKIKRVWVYLAWTLCTLIALTIIYTAAICYNTNYVYNKVDAAFYNGFHRLGWALCLSWIVISCTWGYGGPVNKILSWSGWQPFSRLSYCLFLIHFPFMYWLNGVARNPVRFTHFRSIHRYFSTTLFTIGVAIIVYLCVEAPVNNILRIFFNKGKNKKENNPEKIGK